MTNHLKTTALALLLILPITAGALERIELLPPDAQILVRISNTTNFWAQLKLSSIGKLWADRQFQDFMGNPDADTWQELIFDGEPDAENQVIIEQLKMLKGEVILAFDEEMNYPCLIAAMDRADFLRSLEMDEKLRTTAKQPFEILKSAFQDVEIIQHIENGNTPEEQSSWQAHFNGTLLLGDSREWVERSIVHLKKESIKEPAGNPEFNLKIPLSSLIREIIEEEKSESAGNPAPMDIEALFDALGLMGIDSYTLKLELKTDEMIADSNLGVAQLNKGIFTILDVQPSELPTVTFIPANIASLEVGRFNLLRFWQEIPTVLATAMPAFKPQFDMILAMIQQQAGVNFEQDLLANIGTKYLAFATVEEGKQRSVVALELKNAAAFKTGLETTMAAPALQPQIAAGLEIEAFLDHTLYTVKSDDPDNTMAFGVAGGYLLYGQPDGLRQVIRSQGSATAANESFERSPLVKGLRQNVPAAAFGYSAIDWKKNMAIIIQELGKAEYTTLIQQNWAKSGSALPPPDFAKLPPADHIASFFNISYQYAEATGNGLHQRIILKY